jgi:hypothetical protein
VGFDNPFYPQNYPQKFQVSIAALLQLLGGILAEVGNWGNF